MSPIDITIIAIYLVGIFVVGGYFYRWIEKPDDFFVAGRQLTPFLLAAALTATNVNLYSFIGQSGDAYKTGISIIWHTWTGNMAMVLSGLFIIPVLRRLRIRTIAELVSIRYSRGFRGLVGIIWILRLSFWLSIGLYAIAIAAQTITGINSFTFWVIVLAFITVAYTLLGGTWSIVFTDMLNFLLMLGGALILLPIVMHSVGWWQTLIKELPPSHLNFVPQNGSFNWMFLITMLLLGVKWASIDQGVLQRAFGAENAKTAAKSMIYSGLITTPFALLWILPGLSASVLYPHLSNLDLAVPTLVKHYVPPVALGLVGCGWLSSQMSVIGADLNSISTLFTSDLYNGLLGKKSSDRTTLLISRIVVALVGFIIVGFSFLVPILGGAVKANLTIVGILDMPLFVVAILYGLLWKRANWQGAIGGYFIGAIVGVLVYLYGGQNFNLSTFSSAGAALLACPLISIFTAAPHDDNTRIIWQARGSTINGVLEKDPYNIVPKSMRGKISVGVLAVGLLLYLGAAVLGAVGSVHASEVAVGGMIIFFIGGFARLFYE